MPEEEFLRLLREALPLLREVREMRAEIREQRADVRRLCDLIEGRQVTHRLSATDRKVLPGLLPVVGGLVGMETFKASDITDAYPTCEGLRLVLDPFGAWNAKRLGKLFARCEGIAVDGYRVVRVGDDRHNGLLWRIECIV